MSNDLENALQNKRGVCQMVLGEIQQGTVKRGRQKICHKFSHILYDIL